MNRYGFDEQMWSDAKEEVRGILIEVAKRRGRIPYSELAPRISSIQLEYHDPRLGYLLSEVTEEEDTAGRGMLSAIVCHKHGDMRPGPGFYGLAKKLKKETRDVERLWLDEFNHVHEVWADQDASATPAGPSAGSEPPARRPSRHRRRAATTSG